MRTDPPAPSLRSSALRVLLLACAVLVALLGPLGATPPAQAAAWGAGHHGMTPNGSYLGSYRCDGGVLCFCMDSHRRDPVDVVTDAGTEVSDVTTHWGQNLSGDVVQRLNYVISHHGQTTDPDTAAAVAAYVHAFTSSRARDYGAGFDAGAYYINGHPGTLARYTEIWADAEANGARQATGSARLEIEMLDETQGVVTVTTDPQDATPGELRLSGAIADDSGAATVTVGHGARIPIIGTPPAGEAEYVIEANATGFTATGAVPAAVRLFHSGDRQRVLGPVPPVPLSFAATARTAPIPLHFEPELTTAVTSRIVLSGSPFVDEVTASAPTRAWPTDEGGAFRPVVARGTLYGPFAEAPAESATAPGDAPILGTETVTLVGPGTHTSPGSLTATQPGFYTWVWSISAADQSAAVQETMPPNYEFSDRYGLAAESHLVPLQVTAVSQASAESTGLGGTVTDQLTVLTDDDFWPLVDGRAVEAVFRGTAYFVPGVDPLEESETVPAGAEILGETVITATAPGVYAAPLTVTAPMVPGHITWVWRLESTEILLPWADRFGLPHETTRVESPRVRTVAVAAVNLGEPASDVAIVEGHLPSAPVHLVFEAFRQPDGATTPICDTSTQVLDTTSTPIAVTTLGEYRSPEMVFDQPGTYFWVETLLTDDGTTLHRGLCGLANETTTVTTPAPTLAATGGDSSSTVLWLLGAGSALALGIAFVGRARRRTTT